MEGKGHNARAHALQDLIQIPENLQTPECETAWTDWQAHRREKKKPLTPKQIEKQLQKLSAEGPAAAVYRINRSIESGWQGLWFPSDGEDVELQSLLKGNGKPAPVRAQSTRKHLRREDYEAAGKPNGDTEEGFIEWLTIEKGKAND